MLERTCQTHLLLSLADEVMRMNGRLRSVFAGVNAASGLPSMQAMVLAAVAEASRAPTVAQIGRSLGHPRQVIQRAANGLVEAGLVQALPNPDHKRAPLLVATSEGRRVKLGSDARAIEVAQDVFLALGTERCERMVGELRALRADMEAHLRRAQAGARTGERG